MPNNARKTIILTGADGDIGRAIAAEFSTGEYHVLLLDKVFRDTEWIEALKRNGALLDSYQVDLSVPQQIKAFFAGLTGENKSIWALINNAGVYPVTRLQDYSLEVWENVLSVNLTAAFLCSQLVTPLLQQDGAIVNVSSTGAHLGSRDPGYSASKAGLIGLTKSLARNFKEKRIRVNAVAPGMINTQMSRRMKPEDKLKNIENTLLGREGLPEDVSTVVAFLVSLDSGYITGTTIDVNGGLYIRS